MSLVRLISKASSGERLRQNKRHFVAKHCDTRLYELAFYREFIQFELRSGNSRTMYLLFSLCHYLLRLSN